MNQFKMLDELKLAKQKPLTNLNECRQRFVEKYSAVKELPEQSDVSSLQSIDS